MKSAIGAAILGQESSIAGRPNLWSLAPDEIRAHFPMSSSAMSQVVRLFRESSVENLAKIRRSLESDDRDKILSRTHALKGSLGMFATRLTLELLTELEARVKEGNLTRAEELFENLALAIQSLEPTLERLDPQFDLPN